MLTYINFTVKLICNFVNVILHWSSLQKKKTRMESKVKNETIRAL